MKKLISLFFLIFIFSKISAQTKTPISTYYEDVSVRDVIEISSDTCKWSKVPLKWTFKENSIHVKGKDLKGKPISYVIPVHTSFRGMDDDRMCILFYETKKGMYSIVASKQFKIFLAITLNIDEKVYSLL